MKIAVIDYGAGNLNSVVKAFRHLGAEVGLVRSAAELGGAERLVLPGVGSFGHAARRIRTCGLASALRDWIETDKPFLGICLGMQLLMTGSEECNVCEGLGLLKGTCRKFDGKRVPQMGWNNILIERPATLLSGMGERDYFYFVHSYFVDPESREAVVAHTEYGLRFVSVVKCRRAWGVQFHPEKSGETGLKLLKNWMDRC